MTYNIHHGEGVDGNLDLDRIAKVIKEVDADLVALQEVDKGVARTDRRDLPGELAELTGLHAIFANNFNFQGGEYGNAILTRLPIVRWTNTHLTMIRPGEQRGLLQAVLKLPGKGLSREVVLMNTHIDYRRDDAERLSNVAQFKEIVPGYGDLPIILCGDFNDTPGSRVHRAMSERFQDTWVRAAAGNGFTYSSTEPRSRIDYVWIDSSSRRFLKPVKGRVVQTRASDHLPLVVEFELP